MSDIEKLLCRRCQCNRCLDEAMARKAEFEELKAKLDTVLADVSRLEELIGPESDRDW